MKSIAVSSNQTVDNKLLLKLIVQFLIYTQGRSQTLDPYILNIRQQLKKGIGILSLKQELLQISKSIDHLLKQEDKTDSVHFIASDLPKSQFISRLDELLTGINVPVKFQAHSKLIQQKLKNNLDDNAFENVISSAVALILDINDYVQTEQQDTEKFLETISSQLSLLDLQTKKASESSQETFNSHNTLNSVIHEQIDNIKNSASNALELSSLQKNITLHLQELTAQLSYHKQQEEFRLEETQKQLAEMSQKLMDLETEAGLLRNNLKLAHAKAFMDPLTGLPNRLAYNEKIDIEVKYCKRYKTPLTMIIWDIDHFKLINDRYGHKAGDKTLELVAQLMLDNCRETDFLARYGGEEFIMLLPHVCAKQAFIAAENIRETISQTGFNYNGASVDLTISCGISDFDENDLNHEMVFDRADKALYQSKANGRNRCTIFQSLTT